MNEENIERAWEEIDKGKIKSSSVLADSLALRNRQLLVAAFR